MAKRPKRVMQANAKPISSSFAPMAGPVAAIADALHMQVPIPINVASALLILSFLPSQMLKNMRRISPQVR